jgi:hypothetical protein
LGLNAGVGFATNKVLEKDMAAAERVLVSLTDVARHVKLLTAAAGIAEIVGATRGYLASWPKVRIENLQKIDGGWGTFDSRLRPEPIRGVADIGRKADALSRHCSELKAAGIDATPELLELELYFVLAKQRLENVTSAGWRSHAAVPRGREHHAWSDEEAAAA